MANEAHNLLKAFREYPEKTYLIEGSNHHSYRSISEKAFQFANVLKQMNIQKGDRVALMLPNSTTFVFCYYGTLLCGGVCTYSKSFGQKGRFAKRGLTAPETSLS